MANRNKIIRRRVSLQAVRRPPGILPDRSAPARAGPQCPYGAASATDLARPGQEQANRSRPGRSSPGTRRPGRPCWPRSAARIEELKPAAWLGGKTKVAAMASDGSAEWLPLSGHTPDWKGLNRDTLRDLVRRAGAGELPAEAATWSCRPRRPTPTAPTPRAPRSLGTGSLRGRAGHPGPHPAWRPPAPGAAAVPAGPCWTGS